MTTQKGYYEIEPRGMDPLPTEEEARSLDVTGRFGKLFPSLLPLASNKLLPQDFAYYEELAHYMGGGSDDDNTDIPAGFTYLGQFLNHDITFDPTSSLEQQNDRKALENFRTPAFELDSLYGSGPVVSSHLYDREQPDKFLLDENREYDLPRNSQGTALIGDPRNDENVIISQLHLAFLKFHNAAYDQANGINDDILDETRFEKAQRLVRWHYQWIILKQFLPLIVGQEMVDDILTNGQQFYRWNGDYPFLPVEFSVAAYRFGHSQARSSYRLNGNLEVGELPLFSDAPPTEKRRDLRGGPIKKIYTINWRNFFNTDAAPTPGAIRASKNIDTKLVAPLHNLPGIASHGPRSLAVIDLLRGHSKSLPSGQDIAGEMKRKIPTLMPLSNAEVWAGLPQGFRDKPAPLWYYILKEAEIRKGGAKLGPIGGRIVAEVFIGLLQADEESFLKKKPDWTPTLSQIGHFTIVDLLKFAGVDTE